MNAAAADTLTISAIDVEVRNIKFATNDQANAAAKIDIGADGCLIKGCRFEATATDTGPLVDITAADRPIIQDCTFIVTGTTGTANTALTITDIAVANIELSNVVFDGGTRGWTGGTAVDGTACTMTFAIFESVSLLRASNVLVTSASSGRINVSANDSSRVVFS